MRYYETVFAEKKVKLDLLDKKLLFELSKNARLSQSAIAKKVGTSRDTVNYRITKLKKSGVLQGYRTVVNINKFGYLNFHLFLQLKQPTKDVFNKLIQKIKKYKYLRAIIQFDGKYDLELALVAKDMADCDRVLTQICNDCQEFLHNYEIVFLTDTFAANTFPKSFYHKEEKEKKKETEKVSIDDKDIKILEMLSENADVPVHKIAQNVKLSADAITYRIKKLKKSDYILGYIPAINYHLIDYHVYAILISVTSFTKKDEARLKEFFGRNEHVLWAVKTIGKYNLILYVCTQKMDDFIDTTDKIRNYLTNKIKDYETLINVEEYKYTYLPKGLLESSKL